MEESPYVLTTTETFGVTNRLITHEVSENGVPPVGQSGNRRCLFTLGTKTKEVLNLFQIMFELGFSERLTGTQTLSQEDKTFLKTLEEGIHQRSDGHYEMPRPLRDDMPSLPTKSLALCRLHKLGQRFEDDMKYKDNYTTFMNEIIAKGYAEEVPKEEASYNDGTSLITGYTTQRSPTKFVSCSIAVQTIRQSL